MAWVILIVLLVGIGLIPVGVELHYGEDGFRLRLAAWFLRILLFPRKKKTAPPQKSETKKKEEPKPDRSRNADVKKDSGGSITDFLPLVPRVLDFLNGFRSKLRVDNLELHLMLAGDDPYKLALNYGRIQQALYSFQPQLERVLTVRRRNLDIECSFTAEETRITAGMTMTITIGAALGLVIIHGLRILVVFLKIRKKRKGGKVNESETS